MYTFRKTPPAKSIMFMVNYDDGRTAYLWIDNPMQAGNTQAIVLIARTQQERGSLPEGTITGIRRVR